MTTPCWPATSATNRCPTPSSAAGSPGGPGAPTAYPVFFGSAITGAGTDLLTDALTDLLPASAGDPDGPLAGRVFKIDRGPGGQKQAYARLFSGTVRTRERVVFGAGHEGKVTGIRVFARGTDEPDDAVRAGQIAKLSGLAAVQIGDPLGERAAADRGRVRAADPGERGHRRSDRATAGRCTPRSASWPSRTR